VHRFPVLYCLLLAGTLPATAAGQQPGTGLIVGRVIDAETDRPIAGAIVVTTLPVTGPPPSGPPAAPPAPGSPGARGGRPEQVRMLTGQDGRFLFHGLSQGTYRITADAAGYLTGSNGSGRPSGTSPAIRLADGGRETDVTIRLWKAASIAGRVLDEAGEPAVRVGLHLFRRGLSAGRPQFVRGEMATTDDTGAFSFNGLWPGDYVVAVVLTSTTVPAAAMQAMFDSMTTGRGGMGTATMELASSGAMLTDDPLRIGELLFASAGLGSEGLNPTLTDDGELFVYPPTYHPAATSLGEASVLSLGAGEERIGVDFRLATVATSRITGTITGPDGPSAHTGVHLRRPSDPDGVSVAVAASGADGAFTMLGVPAGSYVLQIEKNPPPRPPAEMAGNPMIQMMFGGSGSRQTSVLFAEMAISVGDVDVSGVALTLHPGVALSGRLVFEGRAEAPRLDEPRPIVNLVRAKAGGMGPGVTAFGGLGGFGSGVEGRQASDGTFTTAEYPAGRYFLDAPNVIRGNWMLDRATVNGRDALNQPFELGHEPISGVEVTYTDRIGRLRGAVRDRSGAAPADCQVIVFPAAWQQWIDSGMPRRRMWQTSSTTGAYDLNFMRPGDYLVAAVPDGAFSDGSDPVFIAAVARVGTRFTLGAGEQRTLDLTLVEVRR
jgi:hypothetical protein